MVILVFSGQQNIGKSSGEAGTPHEVCGEEKTKESEEGGEKRGCLLLLGVASAQLFASAELKREMLRRKEDETKMGGIKRCWPRTKRDPWLDENLV